MIIQAKDIKGKMRGDIINTITFYNQFNNNIERFEYNETFSLEVFTQKGLDELLTKLNLNKEILSNHSLSYNSLLKDLMLTKSVCFEICVDINNNYRLIY